MVRVKIVQAMAISTYCGHIKYFNLFLQRFIRLQTHEYFLILHEIFFFRESNYYLSLNKYLFFLLVTK